MKSVSLFFFLFVVSAVHASVDSIVVFSTIMNKPIKVVVIKPDRLNTSIKLPVVYLLHGHGANQQQWIKNAPQIINTANTMNAILVLPDGGYSSWYFDSDIDTSFKYETFITKELVPYIDANYPTLNNRIFRAITGLSMGGHGALYLALKHNDLFASAGSICGGVDIRPFPKNWDIAKKLGTIESNPSNWEKNTVINLVDSLKNDELNIIFDCGADDFFVTVNRALHKKLLSKKIAHTYTERPGKHNSDYWGSSIDYQLIYFKNWFADNQ